MTKPIKTDFDARELYDVYRVSIAMRDKICGGTPRNQDQIATHIKIKTGHEDGTTLKQIEEAKAAMATTAAVEGLIEEEIEKSWNGFPSDEKGIFIWARQVKALFKECATMLRVTTQKLGSKQIFQHGFEIKGPDKYDRIYLGREKADGFDEGPIHVQTAQGPRTALKRVDYVENAKLNFEIWVLQTNAAEKRHVGEEEIRKMLTFGQENGLGADRSQGRGKFEVIEFEKVK